MSAGDWVRLAYAAALAVAALSDLTRLRIPNACSLALVGLFALTAGDATGWPDHLLGGAAGLGLGLLGFARGWVGGGDGKLLAGAALWSGLARLPALLTRIGLAGGVLAILLLVARRCPLCRRLGLPVLEEGAPLPYGIAIAAGSLWLTYGP